MRREREIGEAVVEGALVTTERASCELLATSMEAFEAAGGCEGRRGEEERGEDCVAHFGVPTPDRRRGFACGLVCPGCIGK